MTVPKMSSRRIGPALTKDGSPRRFKLIRLQDTDSSSATSSEDELILKPLPKAPKDVSRNVAIRAETPLERKPQLLPLPSSSDVNFISSGEDDYAPSNRSRSRTKETDPARSRQSTPARTRQSTPVVKQIKPKALIRPEPTHYEICAKCARPPAEELARIQRRKPRRKRAKSDPVDSMSDDPDSFGAYLRCSQCCKAQHEACLPRSSAKDKAILMKWYCKQCIDLNESCAICNEAFPRPAQASTETPQPVVVVENFEPADAKRAESSTFAELVTLQVFRCKRCNVGQHYRCLPNAQQAETEALNPAVISAFQTLWMCQLCTQWEGKPEEILGWRHHCTSETKRTEYLVKFIGKSYRDVAWVPRFWLQSISSALLRHFELRRLKPIEHRSAVVPSAWRKPHRILAIEEAESGASTGRSKPFEWRQRRLFCKFRELGYENSEWIDPIDPESSADESVRMAYEYYVKSEKVRVKALSSATKTRITSQSFVPIATQPQYISGGTLFSHQMAGLNWLYFQWWKDRNALLADDMGLGKTIQIAAFLALLAHRYNASPALIVVPNATIVNWWRECEKWAPDLRCVAFYGESRARKIIEKYELFHADGQLKAHIVLVTFETARAQMTLLKNVAWEVIVVDEAQRMQKTEGILSQQMRKLNSNQRILLTGTPISNNIGELFGLLDFIFPNGVEELEKFRSADMDSLTPEIIARMHQVLRQVMLRRTKTAVLTTLPGKSDIIVPVTLTTLQKSMYKSIISHDTALLRLLGQDASKQDGHNKTREKSLQNTLMQLRKVCQHPYLLKPELYDPTIPVKEQHSRLVSASSKLQFLKLMLPALKARESRVLIFSQFVINLDLIEDFMHNEGYKFARLDGSTKQSARVKDMDRFNDPQSDLFCFLISTRAGGMGINLATADTVIIFDPDFSPFADVQALSRAHRIGQVKKVKVFRLMSKDTCEEKIVQNARRKLVLHHLLIGKAQNEAMDEKDFRSLIAFGAKALFLQEDEAQDQSQFDDKMVEDLLNRAEVEEPQGEEVETMADGEEAFAYARPWQAETGKEDQPITPNELEVNLSEEIDGKGDSFWNSLLQNLENQAQPTQNLAQTLEDDHLGKRLRKRPALTSNNASRASYNDEQSNAEESDFVAGPESEEESSSDIDAQDQEIIGAPLIDNLPLGGAERKPGDTNAQPEAISIVRRKRSRKEGASKEVEDSRAQRKSKLPKLSSDKDITHAPAGDALMPQVSAHDAIAQQVSKFFQTHTVAQPAHQTHLPVPAPVTTRPESPSSAMIAMMDSTAMIAAGGMISDSAQAARRQAQYREYQLQKMQRAEEAQAQTVATGSTSTDSGTANLIQQQAGDHAPAPSIMNTGPMEISQRSVAQNNPEVVTISDDEGDGDISKPSVRPAKSNTWKKAEDQVIITHLVQDIRTLQHKKSIVDSEFYRLRSLCSDGQKMTMDQHKRLYSLHNASANYVQKIRVRQADILYLQQRIKQKGYNVSQSASQVRSNAKNPMQMSPKYMESSNARVGSKDASKVHQLYLRAAQENLPQLQRPLEQHSQMARPGHTALQSYPPYGSDAHIAALKMAQEELALALAARNALETQNRLAAQSALYGIPYSVADTVMSAYSGATGSQSSGSRDLLFSGSNMDLNPFGSAANDPQAVLQTFPFAPVAFPSDTNADKATYPQPFGDVRNVEMMQRLQHLQEMQMVGELQRLKAAQLLAASTKPNAEDPVENRAEESCREDEKVQQSLAQQTPRRSPSRELSPSAYIALSSPQRDQPLPLTSVNQ